MLREKLARAIHAAAIVAACVLSPAIVYFVTRLAHAPREEYGPPESAKRVVVVVEIRRGKRVHRIEVSPEGEVTGLGFKR